MAAFAEGTDTEGYAPMLVSQQEQTPAFVSSTAPVDVVEDGMITLKDDNGNITELRLTPDVLIINSKGERAEEIKVGDSVTYYVAANKPAILKLPVQYNPDVIVVNDKSEEAVSSVKVDVFRTVDGAYTSSDGELVANIDATVLENADGSKVTKESLEGKSLCVIYSITTRSIPAITSPEKVYILNSIEEQIVLPDEIIVSPEAEDTALEVTNKISANGAEAFDVTLVEINGRQMLPVRAVSEALGLEVGYDDALQAVTVGTVPMGVNFNIGKDAYNKARMTPFALGQAPVKVIFEETGVTYVPVEFFTEVLGAQISVNDGVTSINR